MGSKVHVTVAWGVESLFGAKTRAVEETWDSKNELEQQDYVRRLVLGEATDEATPPPAVDTKAPETGREFWYGKDE